MVLFVTASPREGGGGVFPYFSKVLEIESSGASYLGPPGGSPVPGVFWPAGLYGAGPGSFARGSISESLCPRIADSVDLRKSLKGIRQRSTATDQLSEGRAFGLHACDDMRGLVLLNVDLVHRGEHVFVPSLG